MGDSIFLGCVSGIAVWALWMLAALTLSFVYNFNWLLDHSLSVGLFLSLITNTLIIFFLQRAKSSR